MNADEIKALDVVSKAMFDSVTALSQAKVHLDEVRQDRSSLPEQMHDAARDFRAKEAEVNTALMKLIDVQCSIMRGEPVKVS